MIAAGTPAQLRARARGDRLEVTCPPGQDPWLLAAAPARAGTGEPAVDDAAGRVVLPVTGGAAILPGVTARLAVAGLALRRPTLEEAFLALTGQAPPAARPTGPGREGEPAAAASPASGPRSAR